VILRGIALFKTSGAVILQRKLEKAYK